MTNLCKELTWMDEYELFIWKEESISLTIKQIMNISNEENRLSYIRSRHTNEERLEILNNMIENYKFVIKWFSIQYPNEDITKNENIKTLERFISLLFKSLK